jgi:hypothetical protein
MNRARERAVEDQLINRNSILIALLSALRWHAWFSSFVSSLTADRRLGLLLELDIHELLSAVVADDKARGLFPTEHRKPICRKPNFPSWRINVVVAPRPQFERRAHDGYSQLARKGRPLLANRQRAFLE